MKFYKMQGLGNDYIYVNCFEEKIADYEKAAKVLSNRNFGIGSDGLVLILPSEIADFRMRMFNSDGSEAEMCGNAIRCVGKFVYDKGLTTKTIINIETLAGIKILELNIKDSEVDTVRVDMGAPILEPKLIPVDYTGVYVPIEFEGRIYNSTCVSMGNPHSVIFVDKTDDLDLNRIGPYFESYKLFPRKTNTEFVEVIDKNTLKMRVYERGAGETLACGTGACAVLVAAVLNNLTHNKAVVKLLGGDLFIEWDKHVYMTGSAAFSFEGTTELVK